MIKLSIKCKLARKHSSMKMNGKRGLRHCLRGGPWEENSSPLCPLSLFSPTHTLHPHPVTALGERAAAVVTVQEDVWVMLQWRACCKMQFLLLGGCHFLFLLLKACGFGNAQCVLVTSKGGNISSRSRKPPVNVPAPCATMSALTSLLLELDLQ